jgi:hypothetical protein
MDLPDPKSERLTEFERAVCFDTLPHITRPVTLGLIFGYTLLLAATFAAMIYGQLNDAPSWKRWGTLLFVVVACAGIVGFIYRALFYAIRQRNVLLSAQDMPNVESGFDELPDPFASHALLRYYRCDKTSPKIITGNKGETVYTATRDGRHGWEVHDPAGELVFAIRASRPPRSFSFDWGVPSQFHVMRGDKHLAEIERPLTFGPGRVEIRCENQDRRVVQFREGGLFENDALIGRIYAMRNYLYLDVRQSCLDAAVLAFFISMLD